MASKGFPPREATTSPWTQIVRPINRDHPCAIAVFVPMAFFPPDDRRNLPQFRFCFSMASRLLP